MTEIFGHRWVSSYDPDVARGAGLTWAKGLADITDEQIAEGIRSVMTAAEDWPPSLPQFRKLCLGIPSLGRVAHELQSVVQREQASPFSRLVWSLLDHHHYNRASVDVAERMLARAYDVAVELAMHDGA